MALKTKIFVGHLPPTCTKADLEHLFSKFGTVTECDIIKNYGFVHMNAEEEAQAAIQGLNNVELQGSRISVEQSTSTARVKNTGGYRGNRTNGLSASQGWGRFYDFYQPPPPPPPPHYAAAPPPPLPFYRDRYPYHGRGDHVKAYLLDPYGRPLPPPSYLYERRAPYGRRTAAGPAQAATPQAPATAAVAAAAAADYAYAALRRMSPDNKYSWENYSGMYAYGNVAQSQ